MEVVFDEARLAVGQWAAGAATLGVFDGVHLGHIAVLRRTVERAEHGGLASTAITFDRHPQLTLGRAAPPQIAPLDDRLQRIAALGLRRCLVLRFDEQLAARSAAWFADEILRARCDARIVVLGHDCRFGRGGEGGREFLARRAPELEVESLSPVRAGDELCSSTALRDAIAAGQLDRVSRLLGRPLEIGGTVKHGDQRGRTLGFPTANLSLTGYLCPPLGVYLVRARDETRSWAGVANLGRRPTFGGTEPRLEVHLLDAAVELYGVRLAVELLEKLRPERSFGGPAELAEQIAADCAAARSRWSAWAGKP